MDDQANTPALEAPAQQPVLEAPAQRPALPAADPLQPEHPAQRAQRIYQEQPLLCIGVAVGVGYLLGGGLRTPLTGRLLRIGATRLLVPALKAQATAALGGE
jgi:hypothetical protein